MSDKWYQKAFHESPSVISTRIRLARNLRGYPFPYSMSDEQRNEVAQNIIDAAEQIGGLSLRVVTLSECPKRDVLALVERHLISREYAADGRGIILLSDDERISIMINEEDHIRIQVMDAGLRLNEGYQLASRIDRALDERLHFAYDDRLGYLTQCPTNLGTGMRASLMLHLPVMQESGAIQQLATAVSKLGVTIRGAYGEGTQPYGAFYQISNQVTLGISEETAIQNLRGIAEQIVQKENRLCEEYLKQSEFCDAIWRSLGILKYARMLTQDEAFKCLSNIRIGIEHKLITDVSLDTVAKLTDLIRPGCLMVSYDADLHPMERDERRAALIRTSLS